jgi:hypothetical protein
MIRDQLPPELNPKTEAKVANKRLDILLRPTRIMYYCENQHYSSFQPYPAKATLLKLQRDYNKLKILLSGTNHKGLIVTTLTDIEFTSTVDITHLTRDYPDYPIFGYAGKFSRVMRPSKMAEFKSISTRSLHGAKDYGTFKMHLWIMVFSMGEAQKVLSKYKTLLQS